MIANNAKRFTVTAYSGTAIRLRGFTGPVVVDLSGVARGRSLVAHLDNDRAKRVGHIDQYTNDGRSLKLSGVTSAATESAREVAASAVDDFE